MNKEELERLRIAYEFEVALYKEKGEVITFEQWLKDKGIKVNTDKVNSTNLDKLSLNHIGTCTLKIGTDMGGRDVTTVAHIDFEKEQMNILRD